GDATGPVLQEVPVVLEVVPGTDAEEVQPEAEELSLAVWPNPARGAATVEVGLPESADVRVEVVDVLGRVVAVLHRGPLAAGGHRLGLDGRALVPGLYVVRATVGADVLTRRVTLLR
ncbi:MAG: T9SS type A sorting domain-containing protein, partial [Rhodothermales bacterium]|nr:T9SS type A sorting domain-containing protein [Rhodothermales bacterium]